MCRSDLFKVAAIEYLWDLLSPFKKRKQGKQVSLDFWTKTEIASIFFEYFLNIVY